VREHRLLSLTELAEVPREKPSRLRRSRPSVDPSAAALGGKGARLAWLVRNGFRVPEARVLPADVFDAISRDVLPPGHDVRTLLRLAGTRDGIERAGRAHARLREARLPGWLETELARLEAELAPHAPWGLAVRSSATCEDAQASSLAGLATTRLGVRGPEELFDAVREVWASLVLPRALAYLAELDIHHASMAVLLQVVVPARESGVAIASAPTLGEGELGRHVDVLVNATHGLGAPVVSGHAAPDVLRLRGPIPKIDEASSEEVQIVEQTIAHKPRALVVDAEGPAGVDTKNPDDPALSPSMVRALGEACGKLVTLGPGPWEVEFAIEGAHDDESLWMLQARPVVESGFPEGGDADTVWSCANLAEALPGVATPLTWSVAANFSELGFRRAFAALGAQVPRGTKLVAGVQGRFYLNLTAFMRVAASVPGLDPATLLELGCGELMPQLHLQVEDVSHKGFYARLPLTAVRALKEQSRLDAELSTYEREASRTRAAFEARDMGILTDDGVATTFRDLTRFLDRTGSLMLTCASNALGSFVALRLLLARYACGGDRQQATALAGDLTSGGAGKGFGDLESARPTIALVRIAEIALGDAGARKVLLEDEAPRVIERIPAGPTRDALERWIVAYGDRSIREAELATPRWREDVSFPLATLALYVKRGSEGRSFAPAFDEVGARADSAMRMLEERLSIVQRTALRHLVGRCHKFARLRERMRAWVTWVLGAIRVAALEAERRITRREIALPHLGPGEIPHVFFCTVDEVLAVLRGEPRSIARVVEVRRAEHARDLARPDPPTTFVGRPSAVRLEALGGPTLQGHGASPGVVRAPVRVLSSPEEAARLKPGEILVTRTTDVGWTPLFLAAAGVVTELGGPLSHAAIVARELGVPCVVNASGATVRLRDGDIVRLDGQRGIVEIDAR
jgi:pyruvate,water dikinase